MNERNTRPGERFTMAKDGMTDKRTVLLVGHCGPDSWMLRSTVERTLGAEARMVNSAADLEKSIDEASLLLVNRVLDGRFETESGIELIRQLAQTRAHGPKSILISNYEDAQEAAEAAGAAPGFGKAELNSEKAAERMRAAIESSSSSAA